MKLAMLILSILVLASCTKASLDELANAAEEPAGKGSAAIEAACCKECLDAANKDPSGYDISIKPCLQYELSDECTEYFKKSGRLVMDCR